jgi:integrase
MDQQMTTTKGTISIEDLHSELVQIKELLQANLLGAIGHSFEAGGISEKLEKAPRLTLERALERYLNQKKIEVSPQHLEAVRFILRRFSRSLPASQLSGVQKHDVLSYKDTILASGASAKTVNNHVSAVSAFFKFAKKNGLYAGDNPATGLNVKVTGKASKQRDAFTDDQITQVFSGILEGREASAKAWIPLVMLYSGARPEEVAQMRVRDVKQVEDQWVFDFETMDEGLRRKNEASRRIVPVHPHLFKLGLEKLIQARPDESLFRDLKMGTTGRLSAAPGRWFNRQYLRKELGITNPKLVLYSLRHTLTTKLLHAGVGEALISQIVGHVNNSQTSGRYGKMFPIQKMAEALENLNWEI